MKYDDIDRFLESLVLAPNSRYTYVTSLRAFRAFAQKRTRSGEALSMETVRAWLKRDAARSPFVNVVGRAGIIVRYLDWKAAATLHPFAELKQHYGGRLMTIVRALLLEDYRDALERLRPLPEWGSSLGPLMPSILNPGFGLDVPFQPSAAVPFSHGKTSPSNDTPGAGRNGVAGGNEAGSPRAGTVGTVSVDASSLPTITVVVIG